MRLKSYFSGTVESAMELARKELGEEALLVHARPSTPETRYLGAYEVVFGVMPGSSAPAPMPATAPQPSLQGEIDSLRRQIERLTLSVEAPRPASQSPSIDMLLAEELDSELASKLAAGTRLDELISVDPGLGSVVALVGPPGVGKTTTLFKLVARYALAARRSVHIITTDVERIAAADQLRSIAAILGISCDVAETPESLVELLDAIKSRDLILIDTPGFSLSELSGAGYGTTELAEVLSTRLVETHMVLSAAMKPVDITRVSNAFQVFQPSKLIFTRIDETTRYGALVNESFRHRLPISFLTNGQQIPDDLEAATIQRLASLVLGVRPMLASRGAAA